MKDTLFTVGIVLALVLGFAGLSQPAVDLNAVVAEAKKVFGASAGPEFSFPVIFKETAVIGGKVFATTSAGTVAYTAANLEGVRLIQHTATAAVTASLPASTTLSNIVQSPGDTKSIYLVPITSAVTLAGGTGTELNIASSSAVCRVGGLCKIDFVRKTNTDIEVLVTSGSQ